MLEIIIDGTNASIFNIKDEGQEITLSGWNKKIRNLKRGTKMLISVDGGTTGSPYEIVRSSIPLDPKDQYFHYCKFIGKGK